MPRAASAERAAARAAEAPEPAGLIARATLQDLQRLLSVTTQRLRALCACEHVAAWALRPDGSPYLASADWSGDPPAEPDATAFAQVTRLPAATHLSAPDASAEQLELARIMRCDAAVPVRSERGALAALVLAGDVRPRTLAALDAAAHRLEGPLAVALALGRLERLDQSVRRLDRLAALGALAAEIAHEVRNPLATLQTFLQLLPERREDPEFLTRYVDVVTGELRRMDRLLDRIVETARPAGDDDVASAEVGSSLEAVGELLRPRAVARGVSLTLGAQTGLRVPLSEDALRQVLLNLVQNAIDATPPGGAVMARASARGRQVTLRVCDAGPGIPPALREHIFEPFFTTRPERAGGLGLAITRRIVEESGGAIEVDAAPGGGSEFRVRLQAAEGRAQQGAAERSSEE
ncbi:MAG TPA: HAMP domain-containing sensor histidine kinase [Myxococcota bacterium]|nr:HAMP domain-containing sensor histidine kinase [Myxococcota bacterium]